MQSVEGVELFHLRLLNFDFGEKTKISPGHREGYNHAALHNAATRIGAISIGCRLPRMPSDLLCLASSQWHLAIHVGPKS